MDSRRSHAAARLRRLLAVALVAVASLAGCTSSKPSGSNTPTTVYDPLGINGAYNRVNGNVP